MLDEGVVAGAAGHRPVHDPRRRLAVPPGRHHPVPGPHRDRGEGDRHPVPPLAHRLSSRIQCGRRKRRPSLSCRLCPLSASASTRYTGGPSGGGNWLAWASSTVDRIWLRVIWQHLVGVDEAQAAVGGDHDPVEDVDLRHLQHVLEGADRGAAAAQHRRPADRRLIRDRQIVIGHGRSLPASAAGGRRCGASCPPSARSPSGVDARRPRRVTPIVLLTSGRSVGAGRARPPSARGVRRGARPARSARPAGPSRVSTHWKCGDSAGDAQDELLDLGREQVHAAQDDHVVGAAGDLLHPAHRCARCRAAAG